MSRSKVNRTIVGDKKFYEGPVVGANSDFGDYEIFIHWKASMS